MANPYDPQSGYPVPSNGVPDPYGAHQSGAYPPPYPGVPPVGGYGVPPASNMGWGIAALVKGSSVGSAWAVGDFAGAQRNADDAKKFGMIGTIVGGVMVLLSIIMWIAYFAFLASTGAT